MNLIPTSELIRKAQAETSAFLLHRDTTENGYTFELFRRALSLREEEAWTGLYGLYYHFLCKVIVGKWNTAYHLGQVTFQLSEEDLQGVINSAYAKFARYVTPEKFENFPAVGALIEYLKLCIQSVLIDTYRASVRQWSDVSLEQLLEDVEGEETTRYPSSLIEPDFSTRDAPDLALFLQVAKDRKEQLVIAAILEGIPARTCIQEHPGIIETSKEFYNVQRNYLQRASRKEVIQALLLETTGRAMVL